MIKKAAGRYALMRKELEADAEYQVMSKRLAEMEPQFRAAVGALPEQDRDVVMEYIGICMEMAERETELACFLP